MLDGIAIGAALSPSLKAEYRMGRTRSHGMTEKKSELSDSTTFIYSFPMNFTAEDWAFYVCSFYLLAGLFFKLFFTSPRYDSSQSWILDYYLCLQRYLTV